MRCSVNFGQSLSQNLIFKFYSKVRILISYERKTYEKNCYYSAYNEQGSIVETIEDIKINAPEFDYIVINDCSRDDTLKICRDA